MKKIFEFLMTYILMFAAGGFMAYVILTHL